MKSNNLINPETVIATSGGTIRTNQQLLDAVINCFREGEYDTDAMRKLWKRVDPRITPQDFTNTFSVVYADTYWNGTSMDVSKLADSLVKALRYDRENAKLKATMAFQQWRGILIRFNDHETGIMPRTGNYLDSIDIVCNNNSPLDPSDLINGWGSRFYQSPQKGKNYIYARCQNVGFMNDLYNKTTKTPSVKMFYTDGGLNQPPSSWHQLLTAKDAKVTGDICLINDEPGPMPQGTYGVSEGFIFDIPNSGHYCLIGVISTDFFKNAIDISRGNWSSNQWISNNGAAGWHNVDVAKALEEKLVFYNQDGSHENFSFVVECSRVPVGSKIAIKSSDSAVPFNSATIISHNESQLFEVPATLPAYYKGELLVSMTGPDGKLLPANSSVSVKMIWRLHRGHKHYSDALSVYGTTDNYYGNADLNVQLATFTFIGGNATEA